MSVLNGFMIVLMLLLLMYSFYRLFRKKSLLMIIPVCSQIFSIVLAVLSFINDIEVLLIVEAAYILLGILPPAILVILDYIKMMRTVRSKGVYQGFVEQAAETDDDVLSLLPEGINPPARGKQAADAAKDLNKLPEDMQKNFRKCLNKAHSLMNEENYPGAYYVYDTLSKAAGDSYVLYYNFADICYHMKKYDEALESYKKSLELSEKNSAALPEIYYSIANTYYKLERFEKAVKYYEKALDIEPGYTQAAENLSFAYVRMGEPDKGILTLRKTNADEGSYRAHYIWGVLFNDAGRYQESADELRQAVKIQPDSMQAREELGKVLMKLRKPEEAIELYDDTLRIDPDNYFSWYGKANAYVKLGRWKESIASYKETVRIKPDCYKSYYNMAAAYEESGNRKAAVDAYNAAIKANPGFTDAYNNLGIALSLMGRRQEALDVYEEGIRRNKRVPGLYFNMGMCLFEEGRYPEAVAAYRNALDISPDELEIYYYLGAALTEMRHYNDAIESYKSALAIKPSDGELYYYLAAIYAMLGRYDISVENLKKAIELNTEILDDIRDNPAFDGMRGKNEYKMLVS